jgi:hypothetical protein
MLDREEYVEQAYFFHALRERMQQKMSTQELLITLKQELLSTTRLPLALDFLASELKLTGGFASAMARMNHYFTSFQTFVIREAEKETGRFDFRIGLEILEREAEYRAKSPTPQGVFVYQFETLCRNRLGYDYGLEAIAGDPIFDEAWREWILNVRRQVGLVDFADMIFVRSANYVRSPDDPERPVLFGDKEGRIAAAQRRRDPLHLFASLQRHLGYPSVPRAAEDEQQRYVIPVLQRRIERLESRIKLLEEELRGGINLSKYYAAENNKKSEPGSENASS